MDVSLFILKKVYGVAGAMEEETMEEGTETIKQVLDEHLSAINGNTGEIQVLFDYLQQMEQKVDRILQRMDQLQLSQGLSLGRPQIAPLTQQEKEVFLTLYTEQLPLTCEEIARKSQLMVPRVLECLATLGVKGVPLHRTYVQNQFFFSVLPQFKELQAKQNVLNLSLQSFME